MSIDLTISYMSGTMITITHKHARAHTHTHIIVAWRFYFRKKITIFKAAISIHQWIIAIKSNF